MVQAFSDKLRPESEPAYSRCADGSRPERAVAGNLATTVRQVVTAAMGDAGSALRLGENVGLAIISEKDSTDYALHAEEVRLLPPHACRRRRADFTLGRAAAHFAMKQIGFVNPGPVLQGPGGEPLWFDEIVGSITHCYPWSAAVVVECSNPVAIGVDLETVEGVRGADISRLVCREGELAWARHGDFQERLTMIFSAKEAVYKALYPLCGRYIDFLEVGLTPRPGQYGFQGEFLATLDSTLPHEQKRCAVHCRRYGELVFSCVISQFQGNGAGSKPGNFTWSVSQNCMT